MSKVKRVPFTYHHMTMLFRLTPHTSFSSSRPLHHLINRLRNSTVGCSRGRSRSSSAVGRRSTALVAKVVHHLRIELIGSLLLRPASTARLLALSSLLLRGTVRGRNDGSLAFRCSLGRFLRGVLRLAMAVSDSVRGYGVEGDLRHAVREGLGCDDGRCVAEDVFDLT